LTVEIRDVYVLNTIRCGSGAAVDICYNCQYVPELATRRGVRPSFKLHNPHISRPSGTAHSQSYETPKSNRPPPDNEALDARTTFHLPATKKSRNHFFGISMLEGKLSCLHKHLSFLNCFPYENEDEVGIRTLLPPSLYEMKDLVSCQSPRSVG
jgi:hypothetical protein